MAEGLPTITAKLPDGIFNLAVAAGWRRPIPKRAN